MGREIERLQRRIRFLEECREDILGVVGELEGILSPAKNLVPEIASRIFGFCLPDASSEPHEPTTTSAPLNMAQVCQSWRSVALATPALWSNPKVVVKPTNGSSALLAQQFDRKTEMLRTWLHRSRGHPLTCSIKVYVRATLTPMFQGAIHELVSLLAPHSSSWKYIALNLPQVPQNMIILKDNFRGYLKHLRYLEIVETENPPSTQPHHWQLKLGHAPLLRGAYLSYFSPKEFTPSSLPWDQLRNVRLEDGISMVQALTLLKECTTIEELSLNIKVVGRGGITPCTLPMLESLAVRGTLGTIHPFMDHITVPRLRSLTVNSYTKSQSRPSGSMGMGTGTGHYINLKPFLERLERPLESFTLDDPHLTKSSIIISYLRLLPSLRQFAFTGAIDTVLILPLTPAETNGTTYTYLCPSLQFLEGNFQCSAAALADMVEKRWEGRVVKKGYPPLKVVTFYSSSTLMGEVRDEVFSASDCVEYLRERLMHLYDQGLAIDFNLDHPRQSMSSFRGS